MCPSLPEVPIGSPRRLSNYPADVIDQMLAVPQTRWVPPQTVGYRMTLDAFELLVFEVESAVRAVMV